MSTPTATRLLVIHPSLAVRTFLRTTFDSQSDLQVVATADNEDCAFTKLDEALPDMVVLGLDSSKINGDLVHTLLRSRSKEMPILLLVAVEGEMGAEGWDGD